VPEICNLVFLRRVNSRILFDQMLGRATRLCDDDRQGDLPGLRRGTIYEALQNLTAMQSRWSSTRHQLHAACRELARSGDDERRLVRDQFIAKLQRKKRHL
jgi:type I restriction enzyme R subunit